MTTELRLTESRKLEVGKIISKLNKNGGFITASMFEDVLRVSAWKKGDRSEQDKNFKSKVITEHTGQYFWRNDDILDNTP